MLSPPAESAAFGSSSLVSAHDLEGGDQECGPSGEEVLVSVVASRDTLGALEKQGKDTLSRGSQSAGLSCSPHGVPRTPGPSHALCAHCVSQCPGGGGGGGFPPDLLSSQAFLPSAR